MGNTYRKSSESEIASALELSMRRHAGRERNKRRLQWWLVGLAVAGLGTVGGTVAGYRFNPSRECVMWFGFRRAPEARTYDCALAHKTLRELRSALDSGSSARSVIEEFGDDIARALEALD